MPAALTTSATSAAKAHLRAAGWTYRTAAAHLGISYQHISYVLNGQRSSRSLLARLQKLPRKAIKNGIKQPA